MTYEMQCGQFLQKLEDLKRENSALGSLAKKAGKDAEQGFAGAEQKAKDYWTQVAKTREEINETKASFKAFQEAHHRGSERIIDDLKKETAEILARKAASDAEWDQQSRDFAGAHLGTATGGGNPELLRGIKQQIAAQDALDEMYAHSAAEHVIQTEQEAQAVQRIRDQMHQHEAARLIQERELREQNAQKLIQANEIIAKSSVANVNLEKDDHAYVQLALKAAQYERELQAVGVRIRQNTVLAQQGNAEAAAKLTEDIARQRKLQMALAQTHSQMTRTTGGMGNAQMITQQLAFAVDDAAQSFGTGGFAGALRGAGNNLSMVAMMMGGPVTGAIAGIGIALIPTIANMAGLTDESKKQEKQLERHKELYGDLANALKEVEDRTKKAMLSEKEYAQYRNEEDAFKQRKEFTKEVGIASIELEAAEKKEAAAKAALSVAERGGKPGGLAGPHTEAMFANARRQLAEAAEEKKQAQYRIDRGREQLDRLRDEREQMVSREQARKVLDDMEKAGVRVNLLGGDVSMFETSWKKPPEDQINVGPLRRRIRAAEHEANVARRQMEDLRESQEHPGRKLSRQEKEDNAKAIDALGDQMRQTNRHLQDLKTIMQIVASKDTAAGLAELLEATGIAGAALGAEFKPKRGAGR